MWGKCRRRIGRGDDGGSRGWNIDRDSDHRGSAIRIAAAEIFELAALHRRDGLAIQITQAILNRASRRRRARRGERCVAGFAERTGLLAFPVELVALLDFPLVEIGPHASEIVFDFSPACLTDGFIVAHAQGGTARGTGLAGDFDTAVGQPALIGSGVSWSKADKQQADQRG